MSENILFGGIIRRGSAHPQWRGGITISTWGYRQVHQPGHPMADCRGYVFEHVMVASDVLGKPLPRGAIVHHANGDKLDNRRENLVICQNRGYHRRLHQRMAAKAATGHADWLRCPFCKQYDDPANLSLVRPGRKGLRAGYHNHCKAADVGRRARKAA